MQQCGKFDLYENGDGHAVVSRLQISFRAQACLLNLLVKIGRKQEKTPMFELESLLTLGHSPLSKNHSCFTGADRSTDNCPFFESRDARLALLVHSFLHGYL